MTGPYVEPEVYDADVDEMTMSGLAHLAAFRRALLTDSTPADRIRGFTPAEIAVLIDAFAQGVVDGATGEDDDEDGV